MSSLPPGSAEQLIAGASNIVTGSNPPYTKDDFLQVYDQFIGLVPDPVLNQFIAMANATVLQARWHDNWAFGMANFIAHFATSYMRTKTGSNPTANQVIAAAQTRGLQTSKSVGDVSVSYDFSHIANGISGWAQWKSTEFGFMFLNQARLLGKAGSYVY